MTIPRTMDSSSGMRRENHLQCNHKAILVAILCTTWYSSVLGVDAFATGAPSRITRSPTSLPFLDSSKMNSNNNNYGSRRRTTRSSSVAMKATTRRNCRSSNSNDSGGKDGARRRRTGSRLKASSSSSSSISATSSTPPTKNGVLQQRQQHRHQKTKKFTNTSLQKETSSSKSSSSTKKTTAPLSRYELLDHPLLSKPEEQRLGRQLRRALHIKSKVEQILETKELQRRERQLQQQNNLDEDDLFSMEEELEDFLMRNHLPSDSRDVQSGHYIRDYYDNAAAAGEDGYNPLSQGDEDEDEDLLGLSVYGMEDATKNQMQEFDSRSVITKGTDSLDITDITLSDQEIKEHFDIDGGRKELYQILVDGALAKEQMIKSNIRLVMSIAKKWIAGSNSNSDGAGQSSNTQMLTGSWTKPSLDEVVQEGILGLAKAAERFEPDRNLKFSTYATYYITNEVRNCFQGATTGCLRVPPHYHTIRNKYEKLVKKHFTQTGKPLDMEVAAEELGYKLERLDFILRMTKPLLQLDSPIPMGMGGFANGAGKAGNFGSYGAPPSFAEALECMEPTPEAIVERSLLRQCLENALANELSPHERDVIRLRHGLDDGVSRTIKEVVESCGGMMSQADIQRAEYRAYSKLRTPRSLHNRRLLGFAAEFASFDPSESLEA